MSEDEPSSPMPPLPGDFFDVPEEAMEFWRNLEGDVVVAPTRRDWQNLLLYMGKSINMQAEAIKLAFAASSPNEEGVDEALKHWGDNFYAAAQAQNKLLAGLIINASKLGSADGD